MRRRPRPTKELSRQERERKVQFIGFEFVATMFTTRLMCEVGK